MARAHRQKLSKSDRSDDGGTAVDVLPSVVIAYGSTFGTTEAVARRLAASLEAELGQSSTLADVAWTEMRKIVSHDVLILGSSTWDDGHLQADWEEAVDGFGACDLRGCRVAVFGCGDRVGYPETFGDALGILHERASAAGAELFGQVAARELGFAVGDLHGSRALEGDLVAGLLLDDAADDEDRDARTDTWAALLAREIVRPATRVAEVAVADMRHGANAPKVAYVPDRDKLRRQLVRRTLSDILTEHPGVLDVMARHGADRRSVSRHEIATLVPLRALLAGLCPLDDPAATLDDVVEEVLRDGCSPSPAPARRLMQRC